mmetsp:Transcript_34465/g.91473  ORF Transcript_34465/g.91473 Transcript_34465/m.91473 type:complete len:856 (-) Transcript_34465:498-3065(-)
MSSISPVTAKPMYSYAVGAYCNALSYTTQPQDVLLAIQNNGMEMVNSFMGSSHRSLSVKAIQLLHVFASCPDLTVQALVHAVAAASPMISQLQARIIETQGIPNDPETAETLEYALLALGSLCGAGTTEKTDMNRQAAMQACSSQQHLSRYIDIVQQGMGVSGGPAGRVVAAAFRLVETLSACNADCARLLAGAGALGAVVSRLHHGDEASRASALTTFATMTAGAQPTAELASGVDAVAHMLTTGDIRLTTRAVQVLKAASQHQACQEAIVQRGLGALVDLLMVDRHLNDPSVDSMVLVTDVLQTLTNVAASPQHAKTLVELGGIFGISNLLMNGRELQKSQQAQGSTAGDIVAAAADALTVVVSHPGCRIPVLDCGPVGAVHALLSIIINEMPETGVNGAGLSPAVAQSIRCLEQLIREPHPTITTALAANAKVAVRFASMLTSSDEALRPTAARLLFFLAAASDKADGGDGAMWRALEQSGNVAAVVAVLATATVRLRSTSQGDETRADQLHVASGACGSLVTMCRGRTAVAVDVVNAGGLTYLVELAPRLANAATLLATIVFQTNVHRSALADGDGAACDNLVVSTVSMLSTGAPAVSAEDAKTIHRAALKILTSLCADSDSMSARLGQRLRATNTRRDVLTALSMFIDDPANGGIDLSAGGAMGAIGAAPGNAPVVGEPAEDAAAKPKTLISTEAGAGNEATDALVVLASVLAPVAEPGAGADDKEEALHLEPDEAPIVAQAAARLVDLFGPPPSAGSAPVLAPSNAGASSSSLVRRRVRQCLVTLSTLPRCAEAMFAHGAVGTLARVLVQAYGGEAAAASATPADMAAMSSEARADQFTALVIMHHLAR